jgi:hypothetical protein
MKSAKLSGLEQSVNFFTDIRRCEISLNRKKGLQKRNRNNKQEEKVKR